MQTGVVRVEESAEIMEALLKQIYKIRQDWVPHKSDSIGQLAMKAGMENFKYAMEIRTAANLYLIDGLDDPAE